MMGDINCRQYDQTLVVRSFNCTSAPGTTRIAVSLSSYISYQWRHEYNNCMEKCIFPVIFVCSKQKLLIVFSIFEGESLTSLSTQFRISQPSISRIIPEVCQAIYDNLQPAYMKASIIRTTFLKTEV